MTSALAIAAGGIATVASMDDAGTNASSLTYSLTLPSAVAGYQHVDKPQFSQRAATIGVQYAALFGNAPASSVQAGYYTQNPSDLSGIVFATTDLAAAPAVRTQVQSLGAVKYLDTVILAKATNKASFGVTTANSAAACAVMSTELVCAWIDGSNAGAVYFEKTTPPGTAAAKLTLEFRSAAAAAAKTAH
jgi:hypothetical protein